MPKKITVDEQALVQDYLNGMSIYDVCDTYHIGKIKVKDILKRNNIQLRKRGGQETIGELKVPDFKTRKYEEIDGFHIVVFDPKTDFNTRDVLNLSGVLTSYIEKQYGVPTPTLYDRRMYYMKSGDYWWEQWLSVRYEPDGAVKKCPYCDWETVDVDNKSGAFEVHLKNIHGLTVKQHLSEYPDDSDYFNVQSRKAKREEMLIDPKNYVVCPICGDKMFRMTITHIKSHGLMLQEFREAYPDFQMESEMVLEKDRETQREGNKVPRKHAKRSMGEDFICSVLDKAGVEYSTNDRQILEGKEIDVLVEGQKIGFEFNGLLYHCSGGENDKVTRPIEKTRMANDKGYNLIHIFEDEYLNTKELVSDKILDLLGKNNDKLKVGARKCAVREISTEDARKFLDAFHMQGYSNASVHLGGFIGEKLIAVMLFKKGHLDMGFEWELSRYATNIRYRCQGLASKMFAHFVREYNPTTVVSFADRRWTINPTKTMYTKIGFKYVGVTRPSYTYFAKVYSSKEHRNKRYHKLDFRKHILLQKYDNINNKMTEEQMANKLGFYRIYDCGLFRYVWKKPIRPPHL